MTKGNFIRVRCKKCKAEQIIYARATTQVKCNSCSETLAVPSGGKANLVAGLVETL